MIDAIEKKQLKILKILNEYHTPLSSHKITEILNNQGYDISERTTRHYLLNFDKLGFTTYKYKHGREITQAGREELAKARIFERIGFLNVKIDRSTYKMTFDLNERKGKIISNISLISKTDLPRAIELIKSVFEHRFAMGSLLTILRENEMLESIIIPAGMIGIGTVCSITINGILLHYNIPIKSIFGGVLEIENNQPVRFTTLINYNGTTIDPYEIFIKSEMTNLSGILKNGTGSLCASYREIPDISRGKVAGIIRQLEESGLNGVMEIGYPATRLYEVPANDGVCGMVILGGLNPIALLEEHGIKTHSQALSGLLEYRRFFPYSQLEEHLKM